MPTMSPGQPLPPNMGDHAIRGDMSPRVPLNEANGATRNPIMRANANGHAHPHAVSSSSGSSSARAYEANASGNGTNRRPAANGNGIAIPMANGNGNASDNNNDNTNNVANRSVAGGSSRDGDGSAKTGSDAGKGVPKASKRHRIHTENAVAPFANAKTIPKILLYPTGDVRILEEDRSPFLGYTGPGAVPDDTDDDVSSCAADTEMRAKPKPKLPRLEGHRGYRSARGSHPVSNDAWYYEINILDLPPANPSTPKKKPGGIRVGWSTRHLDVECPVGYSAYSFAMRDEFGMFITAGERVSYAVPRKQRATWTPFKKGDTIGCKISLPSTPHNKETKDKMQQMQTEILTIKHVNSNQGTLPSKPEFSFSGAYCEWFRNGVSLGIPELFKTNKNAVPAGLYYPTISLFKQAQVEVNFGPYFRHGPPDGTKGYMELSGKDDANGNDLNSICNANINIDIGEAPQVSDMEIDGPPASGKKTGSARSSSCSNSPPGPARKPRSPPGTPGTPPLAVVGGIRKPREPAGKSPAHKTKIPLSIPILIPRSQRPPPPKSGTVASFKRARQCFTSASQHEISHLPNPHRLPRLPPAANINTNTNNNNSNAMAKLINPTAAAPANSPPVITVTTPTVRKKSRFSNAQPPIAPVVQSMPSMPPATAPLLQAYPANSIGMSAGIINMHMNGNVSMGMSFMNTHAGMSMNTNTVPQVLQPPAGPPLPAPLPLPQLLPQPPLQDVTADNFSLTTNNTAFQGPRM